VEDFVAFFNTTIYPDSFVKIVVFNAIAFTSCPLKPEMCNQIKMSARGAKEITI